MATIEENDLWERLETAEAQMHAHAADAVEWKRRFSIVAGRYFALKEHLSEAVKLAQQKEPFAVQSYGQEIVWDGVSTESRKPDH